MNQRSRIVSEITLDFGEVLLTYIGALLTYELFVFFRSGRFALGVATFRFEPYLAALAVFVVFAA